MTFMSMFMKHVDWQFTFSVLSLTSFDFRVALASKKIEKNSFSEHKRLCTLVL